MFGVDNNIPSHHTDKLVVSNISHEEVAKKEVEAYMADNIRICYQQKVYWIIGR